MDSSLQLKEKLYHLKKDLALAKEINITLSEHTYDWEYWMGENKQFKYISPSCKRISGFDKSEFIKNPNLFINQIVDEDKAIWKEHEKDTERQFHCKTPIELRFKTKKNGIILLEHICRPVYSKKGAFWGYRGINRDITSHKLNERSVLNAIIKTEEKERRRIAQELHDGLGPVLSAAKMCFETYLNSSDKEYNKKLERQVLVSINDALEQVATISNNLSPNILVDFGLQAAINKFISNSLDLQGIKSYVNIDTHLKLGSDVEITLYRTLTELINNTIKHAMASIVRIRIKQANNNVILEFINNGKHFNFHRTKSHRKGMGLFNISNRILSMNGTINFNQLEPRGIKFTISIPTK